MDASRTIRIALSTLVRTSKNLEYAFRTFTKFLLYTCTSGSVHLAKLHLLTDQSAALKAYRGKKLFELNTFLQNFQKLILCCRHVTFGSSVYKINVLYAFCTLCSSCSVHSSVSATNYYYIFTDIQLTILCLEITEEFQGVNSLTFFQFQGTRPASSDCQDHSIITLCFQLCNDLKKTVDLCVT